MRKNCIIIIGPRSYTDYKRFSEELGSCLRGRNDITLIFGDEPGTDRMAKQYAMEKGIEFKVFKIQRRMFGKEADSIRLEAMNRLGTEVVAFWDGQGDRTRKMMRLFKQPMFTINIGE